MLSSKRAFAIDSPEPKLDRHSTIHVGARPLTANEWHAHLEKEGFNVRREMFRPMRLLKPGRLIQDEGFWGTLRFAWNLLRGTEARRRVIAMRRVFAKYRRHFWAIMLVGIKRPERARNNAHLKEKFGRNDGAPFEPASKLEMSWRRASFC